jgi:hypothetical protein
MRGALPSIRARKRELAFSRRDASELCLNDPPNEGVTPRERGMPGARCTRSRVREV